MTRFSMVWHARSWLRGLTPSCREVGHVQTSYQRRSLGAGRAAFAAPQATTVSFPWPQALGPTASFDRDSFRPQNRDPMGGSSSGHGLRLWHELFELSQGLAACRRLGPIA